MSGAGREKGDGQVGDTLVEVKDRRGSKEFRMRESDMVKHWKDAAHTGVNAEVVVIVDTVTITCRVEMAGES